MYFLAYFKLLIMSLKTNRKNIGPKWDPCGTLDGALRGFIIHQDLTKDSRILLSVFKIEIDL